MSQKTPQSQLNSGLAAAQWPFITIDPNDRRDELIEFAAVNDY